MLYFITCFSSSSSSLRHFKKTEKKEKNNLKTDKVQQQQQPYNVQCFAKCINANMFQINSKDYSFCFRFVFRFSSTSRLIHFSIEYQRLASFFLWSKLKKNNSNFFVVYAENRTNLFEFNTWKIRFIYWKILCVCGGVCG